MSFGMDISGSDRALVVAEQRLDRVRRLHFRDAKDINRCHECWRYWPCPTVAILDSDDTQGAT